MVPKKGRDKALETMFEGRPVIVDSGITRFHSWDILLTILHRSGKNLPYFAKYTL